MGTEVALSSSGLHFPVSDWQLLDQLAVLFALWPFSLLPQGSADQLEPPPPDSKQRPTFQVTPQVVSKIMNANRRPLSWKNKLITFKG